VEGGKPYWLVAISLIAERFLRCIDHVEETVFILFPLEEFTHSHGDAGHAALVNQQEEGLIGVQLHTASIGKLRENKRMMKWVLHCTRKFEFGLSQVD
jgi:hypothetical protein